MKKRVKEVKKASVGKILIIIGVIFIALLFIAPLFFTSENSFGNVAIIPIEGVITVGSSQSLFGDATASSTEIVKQLEKANDNPSIKAIVLEINSPGGSAVASDEIGSTIKKIDKPVVSLIRELGASGGYWIASSTEHIVANRMSITGSIGVISSYLEFSGLMEEYGVGYEQLTAGKYKDLGTPYKKLETDGKNVLQRKIDKIHEFFITEVAENRGMDVSSVREIATGEFYLGVEALNLGLIDKLGDMDNVESYLKNTYDIDSDPVIYQRELGFFDLLAGVVDKMSFKIGEGFASQMSIQQDSIQLI